MPVDKDSDEILNHYSICTHFFCILNNWFENVL